MLITFSPKETERFGIEIGRKIDKPIVIALRGELGAGKTVLAKGIAKGLGVKDIVSSPSFVIMKEYKGRMPVFHIDLYRVYSIEDVPFVDDILSRDAVVMIEWPERIQDYLPEKRKDITIVVEENGSRRIEVVDYRD